MNGKRCRATEKGGETKEFKRRNPSEATVDLWGPWFAGKLGSLSVLEVEVGVQVLPKPWNAVVGAISNAVTY